jgi:hypothetical protein
MYIWKRACECKEGRWLVWSTRSCLYPRCTHAVVSYVSAAAAAAFLAAVAARAALYSSLFRTPRARATNLSHAHI